MKHSCKLLHFFNLISNFLATQLISVDIAYYVDPYYVDSAPTHVGMLHSCFPLSFESLHTRMVCAFVLKVRLSRRKGMKSSKLEPTPSPDQVTSLPRRVRATWVALQITWPSIQVASTCVTGKNIIFTDFVLYVIFLTLLLF
jgi:hypothetical protein